MSDDKTWAAVSLHQLATEKRPAVERHCAYCGQRLTRWTLPHPQHPEDDHEAWYHVCVDPVGLKHFAFHSPNDHVSTKKDIRGFEEDWCCSPSPVVTKREIESRLWRGLPKPADYCYEDNGHVFPTGSMVCQNCGIELNPNWFNSQGRPPTCNPSASPPQRRQR